MRRLNFIEILKAFEKLHFDLRVPNFLFSREKISVPDKNKPFVSVIVPNYGYDHYLKSCVHSILSSSLSNIEVIVVDSSDHNDREEKVKAILGDLYLDSRLNIYFRAANKLGSNRNFGIQKASADYVCSIDPDDLVHPNYLLIALFNLIHSQLDVSGAGMHAFEQLNEQWHVKERVSYLNLNIRNELASNSIFRKQSWSKVSGFVDSDGNPHIHEDWRFWHRVSKSGGKIGNINYPLTMIRVHGNNMSWQPDILPPSLQVRYIRRFNRDISTKILAILRCFFSFRRNSVNSLNGQINCEEHFSFISNNLGIDIKKLGSTILDNFNSNKKVFLLEISDVESFSFTRNSGWVKINLNQILSIDDWGSFIKFFILYCEPNDIFWTSSKNEQTLEQELI
jgi:glycosyltransferase involved in cell wall biosynthesis